MPQSMSTGSNTIGHGGIDRGGVGLPMGAGTMPGGVGGGPPGGGVGPQVGPPGGGNGGNCQISGSQPLVMPGFPLRNSHSAHAPHYSPYSPSRWVSTIHHPPSSRYTHGGVHYRLLYIAADNWGSLTRRTAGRMGEWALNCLFAAGWLPLNWFLASKGS